MRRRTLYAIVVMISFVLLAGCGQSKIDSRQIDTNDGLAYEHNHQDPYTGVIAFAQTPDFLMRYMEAAGIRLSMTGYSAAKDSWSCNVSFDKGLRAGPVTCKDPTGSTMLTLSYDNERADGSSVIHNPETGKKLAALHWKAGIQDGKQSYYAADGETVTYEVRYANGQKDGREIRRSPSGDILADGTWSQGKPSNGKIQTQTDQGLTTIATFDDGVLEGPATIYGYKGQPPASGSFRSGLRDGIWSDNGASSDPWTGGIYTNNAAFDAMFGTEGSLTEKEVVPILGRCLVIKSNWANGALKGNLECTAGDGTVVLSMNMEGSKIVGSFLFHDVITGTTTHLMESDGKLVSVDPVDATATPPTNSAINETPASPPAPTPPPSVAAAALPATPQDPAPSAATPASTDVGNTAEASWAESSRTYQPGFDCTKAQTPAETTICGDPLLSALDFDVAAQYHALAQQAALSQKGDLLTSQREYLAARTICGSDRACLQRQTRSRLHDLRQQATRTPGVPIATLKSDHVSVQ